MERGSCEREKEAKSESRLSLATAVPEPILEHPRILLANGIQLILKLCCTSSLVLKQVIERLDFLLESLDGLISTFLSDHEGGVLQSERGGNLLS